MNIESEKNYKHVNGRVYTGTEVLQMLVQLPADLRRRLLDQLVETESEPTVADGGLRQGWL